jgi:hypothetical protein
MHFPPVLEHFHRFSHRRPVMNRRPNLVKMPGIFKTVTAEMIFTGRPVKRFAALAAERFLQQPDILPACGAVGNFPPLPQYL